MYVNDVTHKRVISKQTETMESMKNYYKIFDFEYRIIIFTIITIFDYLMYVCMKNVLCCN